MGKLPAEWYVCIWLLVRYCECLDTSEEALTRYMVLPILPPWPQEPGKLHLPRLYVYDDLCVAAAGRIPGKTACPGVLKVRGKNWPE